MALALAMTLSLMVLKKYNKDRDTKEIESA